MDNINILKIDQAEELTKTVGSLKKGEVLPVNAKKGVMTVIIDGLLSTRLQQEALFNSIKVKYEGFGSRGLSQLSGQSTGC